MLGVLRRRQWLRHWHDVWLEHVIGTSRLERAARHHTQLWQSRVVHAWLLYTRRIGRERMLERRYEKCYGPLAKLDIR